MLNLARAALGQVGAVNVKRPRRRSEEPEGVVVRAPVPGSSVSICVRRGNGGGVYTQVMRPLSPYRIGRASTKSFSVCWLMRRGRRWYLCGGGSVEPAGW